MKETRNHNAFVFLTTLSVCLGLMLVGSGAGLSGQSVQSNSNLRVIVRQSLYGDALEELVRELEKLRESGEDVAIDTDLLDTDTLLSLASLHDFVSKYSTSFASHSIAEPSFDDIFAVAKKASEIRIEERDFPVTHRPQIAVTNLARASIDSESSC